MPAFLLTAHGIPFSLLFHECAISPTHVRQQSLEANPHDAIMYVLMCNLHCTEACRCNMQPATPGCCLCCVQAFSLSSPPPPTQRQRHIHTSTPTVHFACSGRQGRMTGGASSKPSSRICCHKSLQRPMPRSKPRWQCSTTCCLLVLN